MSLATTAGPFPTSTPASSRASTPASPASPVMPLMPSLRLPLPDAGLAPPPRPWPALREDLQLHHGPALPDGQPSWTVHDPVRHRFLRIDWLTHEVLSAWWLGDADRIAAQIEQRTPLAIDAAHVQQVRDWAEREELVQPAAARVRPGAAPHPLAALATWLLHHYLFFRIPLFNPDRLLGRLLPALGWLGSRGFTQVSVVALALGLFGLLREGDRLQAQWLDLLSWRGLALYGLTLTGVKVAHEFGHALVAKHHGLRVPTMGVAFMVMWPVAYTDTSEAWRLADARARLQIAAAGVRTELTLAAWATLAWTALPDGPLRTGAFIVATMTWVSSLLINLSPFMRFDGYFLLCDWLDLPNLHERSFALARWQLRVWLLGWRAPAPEDWPAARRRALIGFALATWGYRLVLYLGIAWMVYHFGFPALGLLLFAVEMGWFIAAPIRRELGLWAQGWTRWRAAWRWRWSALLLLGAGWLAALPWPVRETAAAVLLPAQELSVRLPAPLTLRALPPAPGQTVRRGEPLIQADVPALQQRLDASAGRIRQLEAQVSAASLSGDQQTQWQSLQAGLRAARGEAAAVQQELARYQPAAPFEGVVVDRAPGLSAGGVVGPQLTVLHLASPRLDRVVAYVSEAAASRLQPGDAAAFGADAAPLRRWPAQVVSVSPHAAAVLSEPMLARAQGGTLEAREQSGRWLPLQPVYRVELQLSTDSGLALRHWRGHLVIDLPARSLWARARDAAGEVLAREVGF